MDGNWKDEIELSGKFRKHTAANVAKDSPETEKSASQDETPIMTSRKVDFSYGFFKTVTDFEASSINSGEVGYKWKTGVINNWQ